MTKRKRARLLGITAPVLLHQHLGTDPGCIQTDHRLLKCDTMVPRQAGRLVRSLVMPGPSPGCETSQGLDHWQRKAVEFCQSAANLP